MKRPPCGHRWYPVSYLTPSGVVEKKSIQVLIACPMCFAWTIADFSFLGYELNAEQADVLRQRKRRRAT